MTNIKCVLFDIGGVLVDWHMSWITSEIAKRFEIKEEDVINSFRQHLPKLDSGKINESDFWKNVGIDTDSSSLKNNTESLWDTYFRKKAVPNKRVKELSTHLKESGLTIGIISNIEQVTHNVVEDWNMIEHFEHKFMSYQIGFSKPNPQIYEHVKEKLPFNENQMLFIDDKKLNVESAQTCGIESIHFTGYEELKSELNNFGLI